MLEFTFCMIILFLMMYGIIMVFRWVGLDLGQRQQAHQAVLEQDIDNKYGQCAAWDYTDPFNPICADFRNVTRGPLTQIDPYFYTPTSMNAVWAGN